MKPNKGLKRKVDSKAFIQKNFSDQQWKSFDSEEELSPSKSEDMHRFVLNHIAELREKKFERKIKFIQFTKYASAACAVLMMGFALYLGLNNVSNPQLENYATAKRNINAASENIWKTVGNIKAGNIQYRLPDSSFVTIYSGSRIRFKRTFDGQFRNVYLNGKAKFKVKRNTARPFSVFSGDLKTTALGTSFTVNTKGKRVSVKLHTGKIVVANLKTKKPLAYISSVGTTLLYDPAKALTKLIKVQKVNSIKPELLTHNGNIIIMKNIPLAKVFNLLHDAYDIKITSNQKEINKITFTGNVDTAKEKPEDILQVICLINNMTFTKVSEQEFIIQKSN